MYVCVHVWCTEGDLYMEGSDEVIATLHLVFCLRLFFTISYCFYIEVLLMYNTVRYRCTILYITGIQYNDSQVFKG